MIGEKKRFRIPGYITVIIIIGGLLGLGAIFNQFALKTDELAYYKRGVTPTNGGGTNFFIKGENAEAPTVLLLGGWGTASPILDYMPLTEVLMDRVRVITVERPGYGSAGSEFSERTLDNMVEEMRAGLGDIGEKGPFVIAAHTTSGLEAIHYAALYPNEVAGIMFLNAFSPGAYYYQADRILDYLKAYTVPIPKYTGVFRIIGFFKPDLFTPGEYVEPEEYAAMFYRNTMSGAMRAELRMLMKNARTALLHDGVNVQNVAFIDSEQYERANPELQRMWDDAFWNVVFTESGSHMHGVETARIANEIMRLVTEAPEIIEYNEEPDYYDDDEEPPEEWMSKTKELSSFYDLRDGNPFSVVGFSFYDEIDYERVNVLAEHPELGITETVLNSGENDDLFLIFAGNTGFSAFRAYGTGNYLGVILSEDNPQKVYDILGEPDYSEDKFDDDNMYEGSVIMYRFGSAVLHMETDRNNIIIRIDYRAEE